MKRSEIVALLNGMPDVEILNGNLVAALVELVTPEEVEDAEAHPNGYIVIGG